MEGARGYEKNVVGLHHAVAGGNGATLDQRKQVTLDAFAGDIRTGEFGTFGDLVQFVDKYDAILLGILQRLLLDLFIIDQFCGFVLDQNQPGIANFHLALLGL